MPGVPSGRGCDACRKQKKKCDIGQPACGRCTRLNIPCIGSGERRYKFKTSSFVDYLSKSSHSSPSSMSDSSSSTAPTLRLSRTPLRGTTVVGSCFISQLEIDDIRFDMKHYGSFLRDVPRRLGVNPALDASVKALTLTYPILHTRRQSPEMLAAFGGALRALRTTLDDPTKAMTAETLCAIYLIMVSQNWMGGPDKSCGSHARMVAHILSYVPVDSDVWDNRFGRDLLLTMCVPVIQQSSLDPAIKLGPWLHRLIAKVAPPGPANEPKSPLALQSVANLPYYLREPENHYMEIRTMYDAMLAEYAKLRRLLDGLTVELDTMPTNKPTAAEMSRHARDQAACSFLIQTSMMLNGILRVFEPNDPDLMGVLAWLPDEMLKVAREASRYRPVWGWYVVVSLITTWASMEDAEKAKEVWGMLGEYGTDLPLQDWFGRAVQTRDAYRDLRYRLTLGQMARNQ